MPQLCTGLKMCATVEICPSFSFRGWKVPCCQKRNLPRDFEGRKNYAPCVKKKGQSTCVTEIDDFADTLQLFLLELCWNFLTTWEIDCSILILFFKLARFWSRLLIRVHITIHKLPVSLISSYPAWNSKIDNLNLWLKCIPTGPVLMIQLTMSRFDPVRSLTLFLSGRSLNWSHTKKPQLKEFDQMKMTFMSICISPWPLDQTAKLKGMNRIVMRMIVAGKKKKGRMMIHD